MTDTLFLLGAPHLHVEARDEAWPLDRPRQLLTYLACRAEWVDRTHLQFLLWPNHAPDAARVSFRQLLARARALGVAGLEVERQRLRLGIRTDVAAFEEAVRAERWEEALTWHRGPFLADLEAATGEFGAWAERERGRLLALWRAALLARARALGGGGAYLEAAESLAPLLTGDDFDEEALLMQVRLLLRAGGRARALRAGEAFVGRLRDELGVAPSSAVADLLRDLRAPDGDAPAPNALGGAPFASVSAFVGREQELAELAQLLNRPGVRLVNITGAGGIGKTRLALEFARRRPPGEVCFVPLAALTDPGLIASSIAEQLGCGLGGSRGPLRQVVQHLAGRRALLVLDNYEHLLDGVEVIGTLLRSCPELRVIVTSRQRLGEEGEWVFSLGGLNHPTSPEVGVVEGQHFDAVQLFVDHARRVRPDFTLGARDWPSVQRLCRLVDGSPLALELLAAWVRSLPLADLERELEANLDMLSTTDRGRVERHRSLRATFASSWRHLSPLEQRLARRLAVFHDGFLLEAARQVAGASPAALAALVDASLLRVTADGRYGFHALLRRFLTERLGEHPDEQREVLDRHARYHLALLGRLGDEIFGAGGGEALAALDAERENLRAAWRHAVQTSPLDLQVAAVQAALYHDRRGHLEEGFAAFGEAQALRADVPGERALLGTVLIRQGWFAMRLARHAQANALAARGLALLDSDGAAAMHGHNTLGNVAERTGAYAVAEAHFQEALRLADAERLPARQTDFSAHLASVEVAQGRYAQADARLQGALQRYAALGYQVGMVFGLLVHGQLLLAVGEGERAERVLRRGLGLARQVGVEQRVPDFYLGLSDVARARGDHVAAWPLAQEALQLAQRGDHAATESAALEVLGWVRSEQGAVAQALAFLRRALQLALDTGETPRVLACLTTVAEVPLRLEDGVKALPLLAVVDQHPATPHRVSLRARQRLLELGGAPQSDLGHVMTAPTAVFHLAERVVLALTAHASWEDEGSVFRREAGGEVSSMADR